MRKKKRKNRSKYFIIILVLLLGAIYFIKTLNVEKKYEIVQTIKIDGEKYSHGVIGNNIIVLEDNTLKIYINEETYSYSIPGVLQDPWIISAGECVHVADKKNGKVYIFNEKAELINRKALTDSRIISIKSDDNSGYIGIHSADENEIEQLMFLDNSGEEAGRIKGLKDGKIIDFAFDSDSNKVAVAVLSYEQGIKSNIFFTGINGSIQGGKILNDEIISKIFWTKDGDLLCIGDKRILKLSKNKEIIWENKIIADRAEYSSIAEGLLISINNIGKTDIKLLNKDNQFLMEASVEGSIESSIAKDKGMLLYGKRTLFLIKNNTIEIHKLSKDIYWADILSNGNIVIGLRDRIEILKML